MGCSSSKDRSVLPATTATANGPGQGPDAADIVKKPAAAMAGAPSSADGRVAPNGNSNSSSTTVIEPVAKPVKVPANAGSKVAPGPDDGSAATPGRPAAPGSGKTPTTPAVAAVAPSAAPDAVDKASEGKSAEAASAAASAGPASPKSAASGAAGAVGGTSSQATSPRRRSGASDSSGGGKGRKPSFGADAAAAANTRAMFGTDAPAPAPAEPEKPEGFVAKTIRKLSFVGSQRKSFTGTQASITEKDEDKTDEEDGEEDEDAGELPMSPPPPRGRRGSLGKHDAHSRSSAEMFPSSRQRGGLSGSPDGAAGAGRMARRYQSVDVGAGHSSAPEALLNKTEGRKARLKRRQTVETPSAQEGRTDDGQKTVNQYVLFEVLGKGAFGKVKRCFSKTDRTMYAVKIMKKSILKRKRIGRFGNALQNVQREVAIWKKLTHPNVVRLFEVVDDPDADKLYLFSEFVAGGAIMPDEREADPFDEATARNYMCQLIDGLSYLHFEKIVHRDIKPGNLLVSNERQLKIADFGVSNSYEDDDMFRNSAGTAAFMAPEMTTGGAFSGKKVDIWAAGITLYMMLYGTVPFMAPTLPQIYEQIREKKLVLGPVNGKEISPQAKDLIMLLLNRDPAKRPGTEMLKKHAFLSGDGNVAMHRLPSAPFNRDEVTDGEMTASITKIHTMASIVGAKRASVVMLTGARQRLAQSIKQVALSQWFFASMGANPVTHEADAKHMLAAVKSHRKEQAEASKSDTEGDAKDGAANDGEGKGEEAGKAAAAAAGGSGDGGGAGGADAGGATEAKADDAGGGDSGGGGAASKAAEASNKPSENKPDAPAAAAADAGGDSAAATAATGPAAGAAGDEAPAA